MRKYIFDVDGTLTPSRQIMDYQFEKWFDQWAQDNEFYLVTGSDRPKTLEQVGDRVYNLAKRVYQCSGNDVWEQDYNVRSGILVLPQGILVELDKALLASKFEAKVGDHIDYRPGLVNFSILGRTADLDRRAKYIEWDQSTDERGKLSRKLSKKFPGFNFQVAGETGIDITAVGADKSQILVDFNSEDEVYFFGDKCEAGGNDYQIAEAVLDRPNGEVYEVNSWEDTWKILKEL